ncbi:MAG TPA: hypothetical protein VMH39_05260 [Gemmatimonadaceae bacterium]|nr:hypothetical protein [Gemmatimonadaceae bacterium]
MAIVLSSFALVAAAHALVGTETCAARRTPLVDSMLAASGLRPGAAWDLAFIHHAGWAAHRIPGTSCSSWPFPRTTTLAVLASSAREQLIMRTKPAEGDIVLFWSADEETFTEAAIVTCREAVRVANNRTSYRCRMVGVSETDAAGHASVREVSRWIHPAEGDRLVRWIRLEPGANRRRMLAAELEEDRAAFEQAGGPC